MTGFQQNVVQKVRRVGRSAGIELLFAHEGLHACSRFVWCGREALILVGDGELILELDGEHYFETPVHPEHKSVAEFLEFVRLCFEGRTPAEARKAANACQAS